MYFSLNCDTSLRSISSVISSDLSGYTTCRRTLILPSLTYSPTLPNKPRPQWCTMTITFLEGEFGHCHADAEDPACFGCLSNRYGSIHDSKPAWWPSVRPVSAWRASMTSPSNSIYTIHQLTASISSNNSGHIAGLVDFLFSGSETQSCTVPVCLTSFRIIIQGTLEGYPQLW